MVAGFQSYFILFKGHDGNDVELYMFTMATIMYTVFYLKNSFKYFSRLKQVVSLSPLERCY